ncbi:MAG: hypothetical protein IT383_24695 [Deltaproteobacteria bacterium]|nr:hypothetical protein [Deltaproteobacteria bacterium]
MAEKSDKHEGAVRTILGLGEEKMGEVVNQLLANEVFVQAMQRTITGSIGAKRNIDKGVSTLLSLVNVPTLDDIDKVKEKLDELEETIGEIADRVGRMKGRGAKR